MSYKSILVHINDERRLPRLLEAAAALARDKGSHILGVSVVPPYVIDPSGDAMMVNPDLMQSHRDAYRRQEQRMKAAFDRATGEAAEPGLTAEWRSLDAGFNATAADVLMSVASAVDLNIASQADANWPGTHVLDVPDRLATDSGRPVLIIPNAPARPFATRRVLVAWNGRREATRAVFDALPLLKKAQDVSVIWIDPRKASDEAGDIPAADLCAALARHGVKCGEGASISPKLSAGETLLFEATKFGWDLLVMGCYGHSRLREFILGGATRHVLSQMTIPVLMSH